MNEEELRDLIKPAGEREPKRSWRCPGENELAAYVEGQIGGIRRQRLEGHFANCDWCFEALAFLGNTFDEPTLESVPGHLITRARTLAQNKRAKRQGWNWAIASATACVLILAVFIAWRVRTAQAPVPAVELVAQNTQAPAPDVRPNIVQAPTQKPTEGSEKHKRAETNPLTVRGVDRQITPAILNPREGAVISKDKAFVWSAVESARSYEVKVVTKDGTPVFRESVSGTQLPLSPNSVLQPGAEYFVGVEANLSDGRVIRSKLVKFRVAR